MSEHRRVSLTPQQQSLVETAHQRWQDDQQLVRRSRAALNGICAALAGPDCQIQTAPDGSLALYAPVEESEEDTDGT